MNKESTSTCNKEVETVKAKTTLATSLSGGGKEGEEITVAEGSKVKDTATLSGTKSSTATGTIKYAVYKDKECKELATKAGEGEVKEGKAPNSEEKELEAGAAYYWQAEYGGDGLHEASTSACSKEVETVKAKTTLATKLSGGGKEGEEITVSEGSKVKDTATLSGTKSSTATGTIKYAVYKDKECKELASKAGEGEVKEGKAPNSEEKELEAGAAYYWQAEYGGDGLHEASTSTCNKEVETVKAKTTLATKLSGGGKEGEEITVAEGSKVKDTATLSGANAGSAAGAAKYFVYSDEKCEELEASAGEVSVEKGKIPASKGVALPVGTYYWKAVYYGDNFHEQSTGPCGTEVEIVKTPSMSLTTTLSGEEQSGKEIEVQEEAAVSDTATLGGENAATATGTVEYFVYLDEECEELAAEAGAVSVEEGKVPASKEIKLSTGAVYYWQAVYSGDLEHEKATSNCGDEVETVAENTSLTTALSGVEESGEEVEPGEEIEVKEGTAVSDTATLAGKKASMATGTAEYFVYSDSSCKELEAEVGTVELEEEGIIPPSTGMLLPAGTYYWQSIYYGDSANKESTSPCGTEIETVTPATLTTSLSGESQTGEEIEVQETSVTDTATLNVGSLSTAGGTVEYSVYADENCEELVAKAGEVTVKEGKVPASEEMKLSAGATYYWQAVYSGDLTHKAMTSRCGDEVETVAEDTSLTTTLSGGGKSGKEIKVPEATPVSDSATLSGANASEAEGTIDYVVYSDEKCEEFVEDAGEMNLEEGKIPASEEVELPVGTFYWQAVYSGDSANKASTSACGSEVETVTIASLTTSLEGEEESGDKIEAQEETPVTDTATLNLENASTATGTVEYVVYKDKECKELATKAGTVKLESGGKIPASSKIELPTGTYYWQAVYSGDSEHEEALSICGTEVLQVVVPPAWVVSVGDSYIAGEGGRWAGNVRWNHVPLVGDVEKMDALGRTAYFDNAAGNAEMIPLCHRSKSAEVFFDHSTNGTLVHGLNMACSGSETISEGYVVGRNTFFKPGLDFVDARAGQALPQGAPCPLPVCQGQATALQDFAQNWLPRNTRNEKIKMIVVSIGGNDFGFANVVKACAKAYMSLRTCRNSVPVKSRFEEPALGNTRNRIKNGILNIGIAMDRAGYPRNQYTILVQDYPSPLPANANDFRYNEGGGRTLVGRCPIGNGDAAWANNTALTTIDDTVRAAAADVNLAQPANNQYTIRIMELRNAFNGRRLCERDPIDHVRTHWWDTSVDRVEWINQVRLFKWGADFMIQEDLHPNFWGQLALRNCLRKVYNNGNPQSAGCIVSPGGGFEQVPSWVPATEVRGGVEHPRRITFEPKMELVAP